jgi:hypothetical protein
MLFDKSNLVLTKSFHSSDCHPEQACPPMEGEGSGSFAYHLIQPSIRFFTLVRMTRWCLISSISIYFLACTPSLPPEIESAYAQLPQEISYSFQVKPILADRCFACHGPDGENREAELRLDEPGWNQEEFQRRILSSDPDYLMPSPESHLSLNPAEKATLIKWVQQGARYEKHWALSSRQRAVGSRQSQKSLIPNTSSAAFRIDQFVKQRLKSEGLSPAPSASKETLIRRLSFAIRGLPPGLEEIGAFLADSTEDALEKRIDTFLSDASYGERMAAHWMDVARYTDSDGYLDDKHRDFSPWRDWVIRAFNDNMPYDQFVSWQLAGDLYPRATQEQILATAFNRLHKKNSEAGIVFEEYRTEYVADRTNTFGKAFLGLSLECARCHDHKYDPVSQKNYYELFAFFNNTHELGHAVYGPDQTPGPALLLTDDEVEQKRAFLEREIEKSEQALEKLSLMELREKNRPTLPGIQASIAKNLVAHLSFDEVNWQEEGYAQTEDLVSPDRKAKLREPVLKPGRKGQAFFVTDYNSGRMPDSVGNFERTDPFSVALWVYPDTAYEEASLFTHCEGLRLGFKGYSLHLQDNRLRFIMAHSWPQNALELVAKEKLPVRQWSEICLTYDGSSQAKGVKMYLNGEPLTLDTVADHLYKGIVYEWNIHTYGYQPFQFGYRDKLLPFKKGGLDELRIFDRELMPLEVLVLHQPDRAQKQLAAGSFDTDLDLLRTSKYRRLKRHLQEKRRELNQLMNQIPEIMVMGDLPEPRATFVLNRGNYDAPGEQVEPNTPEALFPYPPSYPPNRLGLARWLFHSQNPLTARVIVNRIWQMHFGQGLVKTAEDFGAQGALPTHPGLLDWLANWFIASGWDLKALHKLILSSATWQQSSVVSPELLARDPENLLLARGPRFRLTAEMIRDNALAISGLLVPKVGGPSVYPYQPAGLWDEISNKHWRYPYLQEPGEGLYRRSLYTIWKRTAPPPAMLIFDIADRDNCTVRRKQTSTPLQALVLLNDPQFQEASRKTAERILLKQDHDADQLQMAVRLVLGRDGTEPEIDRLLAFYTQEKNWYETHPAEAQAYLSVGESAWNPSLNASTLTALSLTVNSLLNTAEAYTLN